MAKSVQTEYTWIVNLPFFISTQKVNMRPFSQTAKTIIPAILLSLVFATAANATRQSQQRQEARDTRQDTREQARSTKQNCVVNNNQSNHDCRQDKRQSKQDGRQEARDIKY